MFLNLANVPQDLGYQFFSMSANFSITSNDMTALSFNICSKLKCFLNYAKDYGRKCIHAAIFFASTVNNIKMSQRKLRTSDVYRNVHNCKILN